MPTIDSLPMLSTAERDRRWKLTRTFLEDEGLSALLVVGDSGPFRMQPYLANTTGGKILFPRDSPPVWLGGFFEAGRSFEDERRGVEPWIDDSRTVFDAISTLVELIAERGLQGTRVGVLGLSPAMIAIGGSVTFPYGAQLTSALESVELVDVSNEFGTAILPRSPEEIALVRHAARACESACEALIDAAGVGARESDLYAAVIGALASAGANVMEPVQLLMTVEPEAMDFLGGPHWFFPRRQPRQLVQGDIIEAEIFCWYGGLDSQAQISVSIGEPSAEHRRLGDVVRRSYEAGVEAIRPGAKFESVWKAMRQVILDDGCWVASPLLHTLSPVLHVGEMNAGLMDADVDPRVKAPAVIPGFHDELILTEGITLAVEPCAALGYRKALGGGAVLVTADGAEELNSIPTRMRSV